MKATNMDESHSKCSPALQPSSSSADDERQTYCTEPVKRHQKNVTYSDILGLDVTLLTDTSQPYGLLPAVGRIHRWPI